MTIEPYSEKNRTLVVDDHGISSRFVVAALGQMAGAVKLARNAREALATALTWCPHLICMDLHLPDINGLEVVRRIRLAWPPDKPPPRVIILTGDDSGLKQCELAALNIDALLIKPVSGQQLREAAGLERNNRVTESGPGGDKLELRNLFREELERRLPELDQCISNFDGQRATRILHQLIASSAICNERELESGLRRLDATCRRDDSTADLAQAYFSLLDSAQEFLVHHARR
jgi:CheY-like chemotaxis protein